MKLKLNLIPILAKLNRFRTLAVLVAILGIGGYTAYQISAAVAVVPTTVNIEDAKKATDSAAVKFDATTINGIVRHNAIKVTPDLGGLGTSNLFYGN